MAGETYRSFVDWRDADCSVEVVRINNDIVIVFLKEDANISWQRY